MKTRIASVIAVLALALPARAGLAADSGGRAVPKSVLEQLGLGDLVVIPTEDYASDVAKLPAQLPQEPRPNEATVAPPVPDQRVMEARERRIAEATAEVETVGGKVETAKEAVLKAKSDLALAQQAVAQLASDLAQARREVETARASAEAANEKVATATQHVAALSAEGQKMAQAFAAQSDLIAQLGPVHEELKKVADKFNDSDVAATAAGLAKLLAGKREENVKQREVLTVKVREFEDAKQNLLAAQRQAEQKLKDAALAESQLKDANQRALAAESEVKRKESDLALAQSLADELTVPQQTAKDRVRSVSAATTTDDE